MGFVSVFHNGRLLKGYRSRPAAVARRLAVYFPVLFVLIVLLPAGVFAGADKVKIGVLAHRGYDETLKLWSPTARYLTGRIRGYSFDIVPLDFHQIGPAVKQGSVDFVLANTSIYVELEAAYGVTRISTLKNRSRKGVFTAFGGVIFCRKDGNIHTLKDLYRKSFMAVDETSFGGWRIAWLELKRKGIDPYSDFESLNFGSTHDRVVYAVRDGRIAAGTVRTGILEQMSDEGLIDPRAFRILNERHVEGFPFVLSTPLYPEWPFAKVRHTPDELAQKVAIALLSMRPDSPAAKAAKIAGWTTPLDYQVVHEAMKELRVGPYAHFGEITFSEILKAYWHLMALGVAGLLLLALFTSYVVRLNRRLRQSNEFVKTILDSMSDAISIINVDDFRIVGFNSVFLKECGLSAAEVAGEKCYEITHRRSEVCLPPDDVCPMLDTIRSGGHAVAEHVHYGANGEKKFVEVATSPIRDISGKVVRVVHISRDITERKIAENALRESRAEIDVSRRKLQNALDEISFLIQQVTDKKYAGISFSNPNIGKCYEIMNCDKKDCPCFGQPEMRCWQTAGTYCGGGPQGVFAREIGNCSSCKVFAEATSDPIYQIGEHFNNMMHTLEMEHKALEKAYADLKSAQLQILQQEKMASIGQLAAGVAHEINNPIGFIISNLGSLRKYTSRLLEFIDAQTETIAGVDGTEGMKQKLKELRKALKIDYITGDMENLIRESLDGADRVKKIVRDLKGFARADEDVFQNADINAGMESTINIVWNELKYKVALKKELGAVPLIKCNPGQLNQVFMNILVNASQAIEGQGEITVRTWHEAGHVCVSISDTGCGIPENRINRIFEPFYTTKEVGRGTGLGLSIAYDIIKKHDGEITVDSEVGRGTIFTVRIPETAG